MTNISDACPDAGDALSPRKVIGDIEILRGIAICMVLIQHLPYNLLWWGGALFRFAMFTWHGGVGVDLFFAISGFVIARSLLPQMEAAHAIGKTPATLAAFWLRRAFRLLPAAWLWLAVPLICEFYYGAYGTFGNLRDNIIMSRYAFFNVANIKLAHIFATTGAARVYWSLSLEEQFYLFLPVSIIVFRHRLPWVVGALIAYQFFAPATMLANLTRPGALAAGVLVAMISRRPWYRQVAPIVLQHSAMVRAVITGLVLAAMGRLGASNASINAGVVAALAGFLVFAASYDRFSIWPDRRSAIIMTWLGSRSYALYLTHLTAYSLVKLAVVAKFGFLPPHRVWLDVIAMFAVIALLLSLAEVTHRLVEVPGRSLGRWVTRNFATPSGMSAAISTSGNTAL